MAAESLSRKAFPHHIQMWRLWSPGVANSKSVLGRTVAGYLYAGCQLGFVIVFYIFATRFLGWWTPTGHLAQPDILATYLPWLSSFSISLHAGFWEECLFRAVPIAGAALVGQRFGYRRAWIAAALIGQALVFGGAHATYPSQPAYARLVELLVPSLIWGAIFLRFGLLPAIISHFTYDVVLIGLPLFVSSAPGVLFDQTVVVVLTLIPLWVVVFSRWRVGAWSEVKAEAYNLGWIPPVKEKVLAAKEVVTAVGIGKKTRWALALSGIAGLALWVYFVNFQVYAPPLRIDRGRAEAIARETLDRRGIDLPDSWRVLSRVRTPHNHDDRFIWQKGGKEIYAELMGGHLWPPYWFVRFVQFEGDVAQRAEEYNVYIDGRGTPILFEHKVPEAKAGASLDRDEARTLAHAVLKDEFHLNPASLREISVEPSKLPARRDWEFVYSDEANYPLEEGKALITISIAGDEVTEALRSIHTPEEWIRQERSRRNILDALRKSSIGIQVLIFLAGIVGAVVYWSRNKEFHVSAFLPVFSLLLGIRLLVLANNWPVRLSQFSTSEPLFNQAFSSLVFPVVGAVVLSAAIALLISFLQDWKSQEVRIGSFEALWQGFSLGGVVLAVFALIPAFSPSLSPRWGNFKAAGCYLPMVNEVLILLNEYILFCTMILLVFVALDRFSNGWTQRRVWLAPVPIMVGLALLGSRVDSLPAWFVGGPLVGILMLLAYRFVFRFHMALIPLAVAMISIFESGLKKGMHNVHSTALPGNVLAVMLVAALSFYWFGKLVGRRPRE
ncbi:MAG: CPBP family intramembrane metalloprotease [Proteobacteria bacterium]|nr:CPBP family intramembrane metalloprotease [Pseudomonadota bacterium]